MKTPFPGRSGGFSLTEIAIALGVAAFCLVAVMGLLPAGIDSNRTSLDQTRAAALAGAIEEDLRAMAGLEDPSSPRFGLLKEPMTPLQTLFVDEDGSPASADRAGYRLTISGPAPVPGTRRGPLAACVMVTWPAAADPDATAWPANARGRFETLVLIPTP